MIVTPYVTAAPLTADELLLIYNARNPASKALADHYAKVRKVPADRLCPIDVAPGREEIARAHFDAQIRQPIRDYLEQHHLKYTVRCLVTFYDIPFRVGKKVLSNAEMAILDRLKKQFIAQLDELEKLLDAFEALDPAVNTPEQKPITDQSMRYRILSERYAKNRVAILQHLTPQQGTPEGDKSIERFMALIREIEGLANLVAQLQTNDGPNRKQMEQQLVEAQETIKQEQAKVLKILAGPLDHPKRDAARAWLRKYRGLIGVLGSLNADIDRLRPDETQAAVDSELMLLWWDDYPQYRWVVNTLCWRMSTDPRVTAAIPEADRHRRILMAARIDAQDAKTAQRMIDDAVRAEKQGLQGRAYIDARGLHGDGDAGPTGFDNDLRLLSEHLTRHTNIPTTLDDNDAVFAPGNRPDAMLYTGWYSLRNFVDAFEFVPGAVAFHVASFEAVGLRHPKERGWVKNLLEDGVAATVGPVAEPYLESFPLPSEFFGLLLTGEYTLAECHAYTSPFASWMVILFGDPLYRPFAHRPQWTVRDVIKTTRIPSAFLKPPEQP
mgnify:CR=1 FL=1